MNPRPESRISNLENRTTTIEAAILESAADTAEELKAIRQDIHTGFSEVKQELKKMTSFEEVDAYLKHVATKDDIKTLATKEDLNQLRDEIKTGIAELKNLILQLGQQKPPES